MTTPSSTVRALAGDLSLAVVRLNRHLRGRRGESSVTLTQLSVLSTLDRDGDLTPGALASREHVQPPSMTRVIAALSDAGLVERHRHPSDGRQVIVSLSDAGREMLAAERHAREAWLAGKLVDLNEDQLAIVRETIGLMNQFVGEDTDQLDSAAIQ